MNIKNALGFFSLGLLMHTTLVVVQSLSDSTGSGAAESVRTLWVQFMSWLIGGIGIGNLAREGMARMPAYLTAMVPERLLRPVETQSEARQLPVPARVGISS